MATAPHGMLTHEGAYQQTIGGFLTSALDGLLADKVLVEADVLSILAGHFGMEMMSLQGVDIPPELRDMVPDLAKTRGTVLEKLEGFAIDRAGTMFAVTDNDGVQGTSGETQFMNLGRVPGR